MIDLVFSVDVWISGTKDRALPVRAQPGRAPTPIFKLLHDRMGALAHERDGHRVGAHAVARDTAGYYAIKANEAKREGFLAGYGQLPINWRERVQLYKLY